MKLYAVKKHHGERRVYGEISPERNLNDFRNDRCYDYLIFSSWTYRSLQGYEVVCGEKGIMATEGLRTKLSRKKP
jgi:hypothetical protein